MPRLPRTAAAYEAGRLHPEYLKEELSGDAAPLTKHAARYGLSGASRGAITGENSTSNIREAPPSRTRLRKLSGGAEPRGRARPSMQPTPRTPGSSTARVVNELSVSKRRTPRLTPRASGVESAGGVLLSFVSAVPLAYCSPLTRSQPDGTRIGFWPSTASGFAWLMSQARAAVSFYTHRRTRRGARKYDASEPPQGSDHADE